MQSGVLAVRNGPSAQFNGIRLERFGGGENSRPAVRGQLAGLPERDGLFSAQAAAGSAQALATERRAGHGAEGGSARESAGRGRLGRLPGLASLDPPGGVDSHDRLREPRDSPGGGAVLLALAALDRLAPLRQPWQRVRCTPVRGQQNDFWELQGQATGHEMCSLLQGGARWAKAAARSDARGRSVEDDGRSLGAQGRWHNQTAVKHVDEHDQEGEANRVADIAGLQ